MSAASWVEDLNFNEQGLIPAVIQEFKTQEVLTVCYLNKDALLKSLEEKKVYVFRRSKNKLMLKGETSGHIQTIRKVAIDCANNSIVLQVDQAVAGCHTGYMSCFYREAEDDGGLHVHAERVFDPDEVYKK